MPVPMGGQSEYERAVDQVARISSPNGAQGVCACHTSVFQEGVLEYVSIILVYLYTLYIYIYNV